MNDYTYSIINNTLNGTIAERKLHNEILLSSIIIALESVNVSEDNLTISFKAALGSSNEAILGMVIAAHDGIEIVPTLLEIDDEGRQVSRTAFGKKGWTYLGHPIEFTTSKKDSVFSEDYSGTNRNNSTLKFYDSNDDEITSGLQVDIDSGCVETRLTLSNSYDFEIISGTVDIHTSITEDVRMWVVGGIIDNTGKPWEYPASSGVYHVKEFAGGINFKYIGVDQKVETDGRTSKFMCKDKPGIPFTANQFQFIMKHPTGSQHDFMIVLEYFRA